MNTIQQAELDALRAQYKANPTATNLCILNNFIEAVGRGQAAPGVLDDGRNDGSRVSPWGSTPPEYGGAGGGTPPLQPGNPPGAVELGS